MDWSVDKVSEECSKYKECTKKCTYFDRCIHTFNKNNLTMDQNNPTTMQGEIGNFEVYRKYNCQENFKVNICEVPRELINKAIISLYGFKEDIELKNIIRSALDKFYAQDDICKNESITKLDENKYEFKFDCNDCGSTNRFEEYANSKEVYFYCRYCGKKHKFVLPSEEIEGGN